MADLKSIFFWLLSSKKPLGIILVEPGQHFEVTLQTQMDNNTQWWTIIDGKINIRGTNLYLEETEEGVSLVTREIPENIFIWHVDTQGSYL